MQPAEFLREQAERVSVGQSVHVSCPFCNATHENSLRIARYPDTPHRLQFRCYRATCGQSGYVKDTDWRLRLKQEPDTGRPPPHEKPEWLETPPKRWRDHILSKYKLRNEVFSLQEPKWQAKGSALVMPYRTFEFDIYRWELKFFEPYNGMKAFSCPLGWDPGHRLGVTRHFLVPQYERLDMCAVLTESWLDAVKVTDVADQFDIRAYGVALNGHGLPEGSVWPLVKNCDRLIYLPDPDVNWTTHRRVLSRFKATPLDCTSVQPPADPKDMERVHLAGMLREVLYDA